MDGVLAMVTGWHGPSANNSSNVCLVNAGGNVTNAVYGYASYAARPVVSIPRSKVNITVTGTGSTATLSLNKVTQQN